MCLTGACATKIIIKQNFTHPYSNSMHARHVSGNNNDGYFIGYHRLNNNKLNKNKGLLLLSLCWLSLSECSTLYQRVSYVLVPHLLLPFQPHDEGGQIIETLIKFMR